MLTLLLALAALVSLVGGTILYKKFAPSGGGLWVGNGVQSLAAGLATLLTNALPIAAGMIVFQEPLPGGWIGAARIVAFAAVIAGAVLLAARTKTAEARESEDEPGELVTSPL